MLTGPRLLTIAVLYVAVSLLQLRCAPARSSQAESIVGAASGQERAFTDLTTDAGSLRLKVPAKPEPWQTTPPCKRGEHALNGACYQRYTREDMSPPCDAGIYEHDGQCWRAVAKAPREPSSVQR